MSVRRSVRRSVGPSVGRSHTSWISDILTEMKQNSTKNMILSHLVDVKAKIEQKSIYDMKLPFEGPFKNKYAGGSPQRILCLCSVRLVFLFLSSLKMRLVIFGCIVFIGFKPSFHLNPCFDQSKVYSAHSLCVYYLAQKYLHTSNEGVHFKVMPFLNEKS